MTVKVRRDTLRTSAAVFSRDDVYRYALVRRWGPGELTGWVLLNPSTADERKDDPTIARCIRRSRLMGYAGLVVANLFAYRSTDRSALSKVDDPVGPDNDRVLRFLMRKLKTIVAGWGTGGGLLDRDRAVLRMASEVGVELQCLEVTAKGFPRHPLYVASRTPLRPYRLGGHSLNKERG